MRFTERSGVNILAGAEVIGRRESGSPNRYYIKDHLGSTRMAVNTSGVVVEAQDYDACGLQMPERSMVDGTSAREKFTGKERDAESGLDYFGARCYMRVYGRWTAVDPLEEGSSPYAYVLANPVNLDDPDGRCATCIGFIVGAAIGAGTAYFQGRDVKTGFISGAAAGAIAGAFVDAVPSGGASLLLVGAATAGGATGAAVGNAIDQVRNEMASGAYLAHSVNNIDARQVATSAVFGGAVGAFDGALGAVTARAAASTPTTIEAGKKALNTVSAELDKQGASTTTISAAHNSIVQGLHSAASTTANSIIRINTAIVATTTFGTRAMEARIQNMIENSRDEDE